MLIDDEPGEASEMTQLHRYGIALVFSLAIGACGGGGGAPSSGEPANEAASVVPSSEGPALSDHPWRLVSIDMVDGEDVDPATGAEPTVMFSEEANPAGSRIMTGSTGCNRFNATYDAGRGGRLVVGPVSTTRMACRDKAMRLEQIFLIGLESTRTYTMDESGLWIDFGGGLLHFVAENTGSEGSG